MDKVNWIEEYIKCKTSPIYFAQNYCKVFDQTSGGYKPFVLFKPQKRLIKALLSNRFCIAHKYRQAGISTTTALYAAWKCIFSDPENPEKILIVANKEKTAQELLMKIKNFIKDSPKAFDMRLGTPDNTREFRLVNGSAVKAVAASTDALRGYTPTLLIIDEAAEIEKGGEFWVAAQPSLSTGGSCIMVSTPKGLDELYYKTYKSSLEGINRFVIVPMKWYEDPRYTRTDKGEYDLVWEKKHINKKGETYIDRRVEKDFDKQLKLEEMGYMPTSSWFELQKANMDYDKRAIAQEFEGSFLGSGYNFVDEEILSQQLKLNVKEPLNNLPSEYRALIHPEGGSFVWELPDESRKYAIGSDPSAGSGQDFSTICVIDTTTNEQVFEYRGQLSPNMLADYLYKVGKSYFDAPIAVDSHGGYGQHCLISLLDREYPTIFQSQPKTYYLQEAFKKHVTMKGNKKMAPGVNVASYRTILLSQLKEEISTGDFVIRSKRLIEEFRTFVVKENRIDHMDGYHDDLIFAAAIAIYVKNHDNNQTNTEKEMLQNMSKIYSLNKKDERHKNSIGINDDPFGMYDSPNKFDDYSWLQKY